VITMIKWEITNYVTSRNRHLPAEMDVNYELRGAPELYKELYIAYAISITYITLFFIT
jgi:hypothetical protein